MNGVTIQLPSFEVPMETVGDVRKLRDLLDMYLDTINCGGVDFEARDRPARAEDAGIGTRLDGYYSPIPEALEGDTSGADAAEDFRGAWSARRILNFVDEMIARTGCAAGSPDILSLLIREDAGWTQGMLEDLIARRGEFPACDEARKVIETADVPVKPKKKYKVHWEDCRCICCQRQRDRAERDVGRDTGAEIEAKRADAARADAARADGFVSRQEMAKRAGLPAAAISKRASRGWYDTLKVGRLLFVREKGSRDSGTESGSDAAPQPPILGEPKGDVEERAKRIMTMQCPVALDGSGEWRLRDAVWHVVSNRAAGEKHLLVTIAHKLNLNSAGALALVNWVRENDGVRG